MSSKEEKKGKGSKSDAAQHAEPIKKKDSAEVAMEPKARTRKEKSSKTVGLPEAVVVDHSGLIDKKHTDSSLVVGTNVLSVHKAIIQARNDHMLAGLQPKKNKKGGFDYDIKDVEYPILKIVVHWLYSDKIDMASISLSDVVKVIKSATHYQMDRLSQLCEAHLQASLTLENLWELLSLAHDQKVERAKNLCMEFAYAHHDAVLADPRFRKLDVNLIVDENQLYSKHRVQLESGWMPPAVEVVAASTMVEDFKALYESMSASDHVIVVEKQNIKCHKAILGHASPKLMELADAKDPVSMPKEFKSVSADTFSSLLRYLYFGNTEIQPMAATQLIAFAKQLGLQTLVDICEAKIRHGIDNSTCLSILEVAYHPLLKDRDELQKELKTNCRAFFIDNIRSINVDPLRSMDAAIGADLLLAVQKQIGNTWTINESAAGSLAVAKSSSSARLSSSPSSNDVHNKAKHANTDQSEEESKSESKTEKTVTTATAATTSTSTTSEKSAEKIEKSTDKIVDNKSFSSPSDHSSSPPKDDPSSSTPLASPSKSSLSAHAAASDDSIDDSHDHNPKPTPELHLDKSSDKHTDDEAPVSPGKLSRQESKKDKSKDKTSKKDDKSHHHEDDKKDDEKDKSKKDKKDKKDKKKKD